MHCSSLLDSSHNKEHIIKGFLNSQSKKKKNFEYFAIFFLHSGEKARKPEPLIQQAAWCSAFIRIAESELKYHQWCQKTVTWFLGMQKFHNLDSPCMHSGSHIIKPVIYEKQKPFVYLLEQKLAIAWSHPRAIHEYTSISFRSARLCHGTVIFITVSLEQTCFKGCLMSLKHNLQGQLGPVPVARESLFSTTNSIQIRSQSRSSLHGLFTQGWAPREFCTPESVGVHVQQSHGFLLPQPKTC